MQRKQPDADRRGGAPAMRIALRDEYIKEIQPMLAKKPMTAAQVAAACRLTDGTAYRYLRHMADLGQAHRTGDVASNNAHLWAAGPAPAEHTERQRPAQHQGAKVVPARQMGMSRDPLAAALFGPVREGDA